MRKQVPAACDETSGKMGRGGNVAFSILEDGPPLQCPHCWNALEAAAADSVRSPMQDADCRRDGGPVALGVTAVTLSFLAEFLSDKRIHSGSHGSQQNLGDVASISLTFRRFLIVLVPRVILPKLKFELNIKFATRRSHVAQFLF